jgi:hypothetical protein
MRRSSLAAGVALLMLVLTALVAGGASGRAAAAPTNTAEPTVSGTPLEGDTLTGNRGTWAGTAPISYAYQWLRCDETGNGCTSISGATTTTYRLSSGDLGTTLRFRVTGKNADGSATAQSAATGSVSTPNGAPTSTKPPVVSGTAQVNSTLSTTTGTWVGATPITFSYQWVRCDSQGNACTEISSATRSTYIPTGLDAGKTIRSEVTGKNSKGSSLAISEQTAVVAGSTGGGGSVSVSDLPADQRLVVDQVTFTPNPVTSRSTPITVRIRVEDSKGDLVRGAYVFLRSTPILTSTPTDEPTGTDGTVTYDVTPRSDFPLKTGYNVQFYVKAYRKGDPTLGGIYGSRLVQVATKTP